MTITEEPSTVLSSSGSSSIVLKSLLSFEFMKHEKWSNVLFLHWRIPKELEYIVISHTAPVPLDRTPDGSAWIGLVLLTEQNVGPSFLSSKLFPRVTHHGFNVRTYVKEDNTNGIYFASLECDDRFTSWGANKFGMPYQVATMERRNCVPVTEKQQRTNLLLVDDELLQSTTEELEYDSWKREKFFFSSSRLKQARFPLLSLLTSWLPFMNNKQLHHTSSSSSSSVLVDEEEEKSSEGGMNNNNDNTSNTVGDDEGFTIQCEWEINNNDNEEEDTTTFVNFFVERYYVFTKKYGCNWRGQVHHEPWPITKTVKLRQFSMKNIHAYTPASFQPLLHHFATTSPDSVLFSSGVGPVHFQMLQPV